MIQIYACLLALFFSSGGPAMEGNAEIRHSTLAAESASIVGRGGRFAALDAARASGEVAHHVPQNAFMRTLGISRADGPAIGMSVEDHALTRTYSGRGAQAMKLDVNLTARQRLASDIRDIRSQFGTKYNQGSLEAIDYAKSLNGFAK